MRSTGCRGLQLRPVVALALATTVGAMTVPAHAADFPSKPMRIVVPFPPGGANDLVARLIAPPLGAALGHNVIVDNRPGGGANIGAELVARSPADGHTALMAAVVHSVNASLHARLGYSLTRDFAPVSLLATTPNIVVVHPSLPVRSVKDLIAFARARPGQLDYASAGNGSAPHLAAALFNGMAGTDLRHVPYKGAAPALVGLIGGECAVAFLSAPSVLPTVKAGRLRALAVTSAQRFAPTPDLPTVSETGVPGYESGGWFGLLVPTGTPAAAIQRLHAESVRILRAAEMRERLDGNGLAPVAGSPAEFAAYLAREIEKWGKVVRSAGMRVE